MKPSDIIVPVFVTIIATGAFLNFSGQGKLGSTMQRLARFVTEGYGV